MHQRIQLQPAFILHGRAYRDSSRLLDVLTQDYGRVTLVAKGARSARSKLHGVLEVFTPLIISWSGKGEVQTLTGAESVKNTVLLAGKHIISAYYMNELLQRLTIPHDPHPELFVIYKEALEGFANEETELVLRRFEKKLLSEIGYGMNLLSESESGYEILKDEEYFYDVEKGALNIKNNPDTDVISVFGETLLDLEAGKFSSSRSQSEAKKLMRIILGYHLGDKPLKTRSLHWYKPL